MLKRIDYTQARDILLSQPAAHFPEWVPLETALDRVLARNIYATLPVPSFDKSPFDGFAFRAADVPGTLAIAGEASAGVEELSPLRPGTAMRIFTGAPIPEGADAVVKAEDTETSGGKVRISRSFVPNTNIIKAGETLAPGSLVAKAGTILSPAQLGTLASQGSGSVSVYKKPRAVLINTGSEIVAPGQPCPKYSIYNSSGYSLSGYLRHMGQDVTNAGIVPDEKQRICKAVAEAMASDADIVLTTGGASVGSYDFALETAESIGAEILFWKVNVKPSGALLAAAKNGKLYLGLSGNPAAALMSLLVVIQPYLRKLTGAAVQTEELFLPLREAFSKTSSTCRMLRGHLFIEDGRAYFARHDGQTNGNIASFANCELIGIIPGSAGPLPAGTVIKVLRLPPDICR